MHWIPTKTYSPTKIRFMFFFFFQRKWWILTRHMKHQKVGSEQRHQKYIQNIGITKRGEEDWYLTFL